MDARRLRCSDGGEQLDNAPLKRARPPGTDLLVACPASAYLGRELQQLNCIEIAHVTADALGCVEHHVRLGRERIA